MPRRPQPAQPAYRNIEVLVDKKGLNIYAKDGYYPVPAARYRRGRESIRAGVT